MKKSFFLSSAGTSLIELSIAVFIGSIIITAAYRSHEYLSRSAERENQKAMIQRDLITATEKMSREVRMAGLELPGNGIHAILSDTSSDEIQIFSNESKSKTKLAANLQYTHIKILVTDASGADANGWVCIAEEGLDTIYCKIASISNAISLPDTIFLNGIVGAGTFTNPNTDIYFCKRMSFKVNKTGTSKTFTLQRNNSSYNLANKIDTLNVSFRNAAGAVITTSLEKAVVVSIFVGGYIGSGSNRNLISENVDINIRNFD